MISGTWFGYTSSFLSLYIMLIYKMDFRFWRWSSAGLRYWGLYSWKSTKSNNHKIKVNAFFVCAIIVYSAVCVYVELKSLSVIEWLNSTVQLIHKRYVWVLLFSFQFLFSLFSILRSTSRTVCFFEWSWHQRHWLNWNSVYKCNTQTVVC